MTDSGAPFLMHGDSAWALIAQLSRENAVAYLNDRQSRQFNTIIVSLLERYFATNAPRNFYNEPPFTTVDDFSTPNEAYFAHADYVIGQAQQRGILVLLVPAYLGVDGGAEGWYSVLSSNGTAKLTGYGQYVATRYAGFSNIIWVGGGDYNPPDKTFTRAIQQGISNVIPSALQTAHCSRGTAALDFWSGESWLNVNNSYTGSGDVDASLAQYQQPQQTPYFLIEGRYEHSTAGTPATLRAQAYVTMLCGGFGHVYGNEDVWHFDGPGIFPVVDDWQTALGSAGAQKMQIFRTFFGSLAWELLVPDIAGQFLVAGKLTGASKAAVAVASDQSFGVVYTPSQRTMTVDLSRLAGPNVRARWFDPTSGSYTTISGSPFANNQSRDFTPPAANSDGDADWALILDSV